MRRRDPLRARRMISSTPPFISSSDQYSSPIDSLPRNSCISCNTSAGKGALGGNAGMPSKHLGVQKKGTTIFSDSDWVPIDASKTSDTLDVFFLKLNSGN